MLHAKLAACVCFAVVAATGAAADEPDVREILTRADAATEAVRAYSFKAVRRPEGLDAARFGRANVVTMRLKYFTDGSPRLVWIETESPEGASYEFKTTLACDGRSYVRVDWPGRQADRGLARDAEELLDRALGPRSGSPMREFHVDEPFGDELNAERATYEGAKTINGVDCHVVYVVYRSGAGEARWYFGVEDSLPRRVDRIDRSGERVGQYVTELSELKVGVKFNRSDFQVEIPRGFSIREIDKGGPGNRREAEILEVGREAPDWELRTPSGAAVSLRSLGNKVVVLDFWSTWSRPCREWMPKIQALHEKYADKGVVVFGVNAWEDVAADPVAFMQRAGLTYGLLLNGDEVAKAYRTPGFPCDFVIDADGYVVYADAGVDNAELLEAAILRALAAAER